jgi:hypothetical protein
LWFITHHVRIQRWVFLSHVFLKGKNDADLSLLETTREVTQTTMSTDIESEGLQDIKGMTPNRDMKAE